MEELGIKHKCDKILMNKFHIFYEKYFFELKDKNINILEIGVGDKNSMYMFLEYFPKCKYYGIDILKDNEKTDRYEIMKGDQNDINFLTKVIDNTPKFDIIIDDGSHFSKHQLTSFNFLFKKLNKNGIYIIESIETSYWKNNYNLNGNIINIGVESSDNIVSIFSKLLHYVNLKHIDKHDKIILYNTNTNNYYFHNYIIDNIYSISFYPNCIIIIHS